jgi:hypothetical protein
LCADLEQPLRVLGRRAGSLSCDRVEHRADEERVAARRRLEGGTESLVRLQTMHLARKDGNRGTPKRFEEDRGGLRIGDELCNKFWIAALSLRRPRSCGDEEGYSIQPSREVEEPAQRGGVRPVQVVDSEKGRLLKSNVGRDPVEAMEDREGALRWRFLRTGELRGTEERLYELSGA